LLALAFGIACYLAWTSARGGAPIGCGPESGCGQVLRDPRWAYWLGMRVSLLSLGVYGVMLATTLGLDGPRTRRSQCAAVLFAGALLLLGAAVWFSSLQLFVIKRFCPFCLAAHLCGVLAAGLVLSVLRVRAVSAAASEIGNDLSGRTALQLSVAALAVLGVLVAGQVAQQPPTFTVKSIPSNGLAAPMPSPPVSPPAAATVTPSPEGIIKSQAEPPRPTLSTPSRMFPIYSGRFAVDLDAVPVIGASTNAQVMVSLFDYTCYHCRLMHPRLLAAQQAFSNQLVIASLPMPLDPQCNHTVKVSSPDHTNACAYARLGLTVWRADRSKYRAFDDWMFASEKPPPAAQAQDYARQLVGEGTLTEASRDPWVEQQLKLDVLIYELAYKYGQGSMPQLIVGSKVAVGTFPQTELLRLLEENLGLKTTPL
jgi:uncharacterized membrane protein